MKTSLKVIFSALAVAALLSSPASAKSRHHRYSYPFYGAYGSYGYNGSHGPYMPNSQTPRYDFQGGGGNKG